MPDNSLREVEWLRRYETGWQDLVDDFYVPALSRAMRYDRKAGFFSSTALAVAATGVARLLGNGGNMRLLVGVKLSEQDVAAIAEGYRLRDEVIAEALQRHWYLTADEIARDRLGVLAEMVARELLEVRVVAPLDERGQPLRGAVGEGMFHRSRASSPTPRAARSSSWEASTRARRPGGITSSLSTSTAPGGMTLSMVSGRRRTLRLCGRGSTHAP